MHKIKNSNWFRIGLHIEHSLVEFRRFNGLNIKVIELIYMQILAWIGLLKNKEMAISLVKVVKLLVRYVYSPIFYCVISICILALKLCTNLLLFFALLWEDRGIIPLLVLAILAVASVLQAFSYFYVNSFYSFLDLIAFISTIPHIIVNGWVYYFMYIYHSAYMWLYNWVVWLEFWWVWSTFEFSVFQILFNFINHISILILPLIYLYEHWLKIRKK